MKFQFLEDHRQEYEVKRMCRVLDVSECGYYAWRKRPKSQRDQKNKELTGHIERVYQHNHQVYGSPRIHGELQAEGVSCSRKRVARLMRVQGISAQRRRRRLCTTDSHHADPIAENLLARDFGATEPNKKWVGDITGIQTAQGWLYLAVVVDLYSRLVVGWSMSSRREEALVEDALLMALKRRAPQAGLLFHSDRGSQYTSHHYQQLLTQYQIKVSMSRKGNCWDNAPTESFFGTLKTEWVDHRRYATYTQARQSVFAYIETFYNRKRRHSTLGYLSPVVYEHQSRKEP